MATKQRAKFAIQPFKTVVNTPEQYRETAWETIRAAITQIHNKNASSLSFEELYRNAYHMVLHKHGDMLYQGLEDELRAYLQKVAAEVANTNDHDLLDTLKARWEDHKTASLMIRDILMYMDRTYVKKMRKALVYELALQLFRDEVIRNKSIRPRVQKRLLDLVQTERAGDDIPRDLVRAITQMLMDLGWNVYIEEFERQLLEETSRFYRAEADANIRECTCPNYLHLAHTRINQEQARVAAYLDKSSDEKIRSRVEKELIQQHMHTLVEMDSGFVFMLRNSMLEDLHLMCMMFSRIKEGHDVLRALMKKEVEEKGKAIVTDSENLQDPVAFVRALLELKRKFNEIITKSFDDDRSFHHTLSSAFEMFVNLEPRAPEFLSLFVDDCLRKGLKGKNDDEVEGVLDSVMSLFRFLQDRDVFERYYKNHLAKRLLLVRAASDDWERMLIQKLKIECGNQFTSKIEGMFRDVQVSREFGRDFSSSSRFEMSVNILTKGVWPMEQPYVCQLPAELNEACEQFKAFYLSKHTGRCLTWQSSLGTAELQVRFDTQERELAVNTHQMVILLLFNERDTCSFQFIVDKTQIPLSELKRQLQSLACGKNKVLLKSPKGKDVDNTDEFSFNGAFTSKLFRVKIGTVSAQKESEVQNQDTRGKVDSDRKLQIEAAIVRIMKARKALDHNNLIAEVLKQLQSRFKPNTNSIKSRIDSLIEREFIERAPDNMRMYHYLA